MSFVQSLHFIEYHQCEIIRGEMQYDGPGSCQCCWGDMIVDGINNIFRYDTGQSYDYISTWENINILI